MQAERNKRVPENIVLIGFMGTGKSTISAYLGKMFSMKVVEMDETIEAGEGMGISQIFALHGENYFRELETRLLVDLQDEKRAIISCGGGVPLRERNVEEMKKIGTVVLLTASPRTIYERLKDTHERPVLENHMELSYIEKLMEQRRERYLAAADLTVAVDGKTVEEIGRELTERLVCFEADRKEA